jgi:prolyl 4-hydroxylase
MSTLTAEQLQARAKAGDPAAQIMLSRLFDQQGRHDTAVAWLKAAADGGDITAATVLGARLLVGRAAPFEPARGAALIYGAADKGGAEACGRAAVLNALGIGRALDWKAALDWLCKAAERGDVPARGQLAVLTDDAGLSERIARGAPLSENSWRKARRAVDIDGWLSPPAAEEIAEEPRIRVFREFAPAAARIWIVDKAKGRLDALRVYDAEAGGVRADAMRTSRGTGFGLLDTDLVVTVLRARMAAAAGLGAATFEPVNVLNYQVGQQYEPHYDFLNPDQPALARTLALQGQRVATVLTYLNGDYEGGETRFPELDWSFKANAGDALLFFNVDKAGRPVAKSLHAGLPPARGEKWLLSQWIRDKPQPII